MTDKTRSVTINQRCQCGEFVVTEHRLTDDFEGPFGQQFKMRCGRCGMLFLYRLVKHRDTLQVIQSFTPPPPHTTH